MGRINTVCTKIFGEDSPRLKAVSIVAAIVTGVGLIVIANYLLGGWNANPGMALNCIGISLIAGGVLTELFLAAINCSKKGEAPALTAKAPEVVAASELAEVVVEVVAASELAEGGASIRLVADPRKEYGYETPYDLVATRGVVENAMRNYFALKYFSFHNTRTVDGVEMCNEKWVITKDEVSAILTLASLHKEHSLNPVLDLVNASFLRIQTQHHHSSKERWNMFRVYIERFWNDSDLIRGGERERIENLKDNVNSFFMKVLHGTAWKYGRPVASSSIVHSTQFCAGFRASQHSDIPKDHYSHASNDRNQALSLVKPHICKSSALYTQNS